MKRFLRFSFLTFLLALPCFAKDLHISIPKRTKPTPVQKLNRDGVKQIEKHNYGEAKKLFYKAYLLDPNDPFTLNNLGYIAELESERTVEAEGRIENIKELSGVAAEFESRFPDGGLSEFFGIGAFWFRLAFLIALIPGGVPGFTLYLFLWIVIPGPR